MATYANLEIDHYYLVRETADGEIILVQPLMETGKCFLLLYLDDVETTTWKKKDDAVHEIIEELTLEQVAEYEDLFEDENDWMYTQPGLDDDDEELEDEEFEEEEEDDEEE